MPDRCTAGCQGSSDPWQTAIFRNVNFGSWCANFKDLYLHKGIRDISIVWAITHTPSVDFPPIVDSKNPKKNKKKKITFLCYWRLNAGFRHFAKIREKFTLRARSRQREEIIYWFWWRLKAMIHSYRLVYDTCLIIVFRRLRGQMNARQNAFFEKRPISNWFSATRCNTTSMCHDLIHSILS